MSPDVLARKLERLSRYLADLDKHRGRTAPDIRENPYEVERLFELVIQVGVDIVAHSIEKALQDFNQLLDIFRPRLDQD